MDSNNWRPTTQPDQPPPIDGGGDWRTQFQPESRQRIVNKIMETLKRHVPFSGQDGLQELKKIAIRFEEKIYSAATNQTDYLRKISLKMLTMESNNKTALPSAMPSNSAGAGVSRNPQDQVPSQNMQSQVHNQGQSVPLQMVSNQPQRQQLLAQNMQNNLTSSGMQTSASLPNSLPPVSGLTQNTMSNVAHNPNLQNISGISQNSMGNTMNQGVASNMFTNSQRQMQGRPHTQQVGSQQQSQQSQNSQQYMYQQQLQQQMLKQKLQQGNIQQPLMQTPMQQQQQQQQQQPQQQQNLLQAAQLQSSQQPMMPTSSVVQPSMISGLQQNQQSIQQPSQPVLQQHQQSVLRQQQQQQQQQQQTPVIQQQQTQMSQQSMMPSQQQQQLMGQQPNSVNVQQNQMIGQQSNMADMQQQQQQKQQRLLGQQNSVPNLPSQPQSTHQNLQQQHLIGQQNNLSNMHQQQLGHQSHVGGLPQQQQLIGTQSGSTSMQANQHSLHMMQQSKAPVQQQTQAASSLLSGGGQQSQSQSQQQLLSQLQSQPAQLQQQLGMQQQPSTLQQSMQQRIQPPNSLLQQQNMIDQQKQLYHPQRPEGPSTSLDSTAQTGVTNAGDWQEEVYQKIKTMKDLYFADLNEMYQKISMKLQQHDSLPQQPKSEQLEKLKLFKQMLERGMQLLQCTKSNILPSHREKLPSFEKQIVGMLNSNRPRKPVPSVQQGQILPPQIHSMQQPQQSHSQISQAHSHDNGANPQLQSMNLQGSVATMPQTNVSSLQHGSVPSLSAITSSQQSIGNSLQPTSALDSGQGNAPSSMQQVAMASLQQNPVSAPQQANISSLQPQSGVNLLQQNMNPLQSNSNKLQNQHLKQQEQILQSQQLKQQIQNRHIQHQLMQKQQMLHQQQPQQQLHQQAKQQQATQMHAQQMPQLHQINDVNELKMRQGLGLRSGAFPQHLTSAQRYAHQQMKPGGSFPISSPQLLQAVSPQLNQHSSPQIDQQNLPPSIPKGATPLHSANSPFVPSPSTPLAPSPMPGDSEKPAVSSLSNATNIGHQQTTGPPAAPQSLSIGTPGISPSPFLDCSGPDGAHGNSSTVSGKSNITEQPLERLLKAVKSISPKALNASVSDIGSVVSMIDRIAGSAPGNGSRATVGEDLVAMTKCRLQARNFLTPDGSSGTKKMRRYTSAMPLNVASSVGSMNDSLKQFMGSETSELESTATSSIKKARIEVNPNLIEEIRDINERLIDTVVDISDEDADPSITAAGARSEGTIVRCCFSAISLSPNLKSQYTSAQMSPIQPLRLLVPANYPNCSPILLDKLPVEVSKEYEDLSVKAKSRFSLSLRNLSQPMSLREIARTWDDCARAVISEYAQQNGGGTFSSKYGTWENCMSAA